MTTYVKSENSEDSYVKVKNKKEIGRLLKFFLFSISAGLIEICVFTILNELTDWSYWPCYLIALVISVLWNFTLNRRYTFKSASNVPVAMLKVAAFYCVFTPVSTIVGNHLVESLKWNEYLVTFMNLGMNFITEYLYDRLVVFGKSIDTNTLAMKEDKKC